MVLGPPLILTMMLLALAGCVRDGPSAPDAAADPSAVRAVALAWKKAYNAGDAAAVAALYAPDAVLSAPGEPLVRGSTAIREYFAGKVAQFSAAGLTVTDEPVGEVAASGELAWQWETYQVADRSGAVLDAGKLVTLFRRIDGKWMIAGDTWNSDATRAAGLPAVAGRVGQ